jgi:peptidoglycan hydrolase-like protein with peptidoglycan-binding domain
MLTGSLAMPAHGNDQTRSKTKARATKPTAATTITTGGNTSAVRTVRSRQIAIGGTTAVRTGTVRNRSTTYVSGSGFGYSYPYRSYGFGYGYPYYSYGYYPYDYYGSYPYTYGYYYGQPGYNTYGNGSIVIQVQSRLARAGYYRGPIDGIMGPGTRFAIRAYERDHGLRVDGVISGPLVGNMGLRY